MTKVIAVVTTEYGQEWETNKDLAKNRVEKAVRYLTDCPKLDRIIIATPEKEIAAFADANGWQSELTYYSNKSTVEDCAQASVKYWATDIILNIHSLQTMPDSTSFESMISKMLDNNWMQIGCFKKGITEKHYIESEHTVKLVCDNYDKVLYMSRGVIPFPFLKDNRVEYFEYIPLHAFRNKTLQEIAALSPGTLEIVESVEPLRWLEYNYSVYAFPCVAR